MKSEAESQLSELLGGTIQRGFPVAEFEARLAIVQDNMTTAGVDVLLFTTEPEIRYYSGFLTQFWQSPTRPWFFVVPSSGKPVAIIPSIGLDAMNRTWIDDIRTWSSPHASDDGISLVCETIGELIGNSGKIGMMMGRETQLRMPLSDYHQLREIFSGCEFVDVTGIVQKQRSIKSPLEIAKIRNSAQIASRAFSLLPELIVAGMDEHSLFRVFKQTCLSEGADDVSYLVGGAGQGGYGDIISPPSDRTLSDGDVMILDTGCLWDGYFCDFDRNFAIGKPDDAVEKAYAIVWGATQAALDVARPGISCADLFSVMNIYMKPHMHSESSGEVGRLGHGLGMQLTEFPSLTDWDQTELVPGMVLTLEPGYMFAPGKMMVHEENIVITEDGAELLSQRAPEMIPVIE